MPDFIVDPSTGLYQHQDYSQDLGGSWWAALKPGPQPTQVSASCEDPGSSRLTISHQEPRLQVRTCTRLSGGLSARPITADQIFLPTPAPGQLLWPQPQDQLLGIQAPNPPQHHTGHHRSKLQTSPQNPRFQGDSQSLRFWTHPSAKLVPW